MLAYEGHCDELRMIHGSGDDDKKSNAKKIPLDADSFEKAFSGS